MSEEIWTIGRLIQTSTDYLRRQGSESPRLDAQLLLVEVTGLDKTGLYIQWERPATAPELTAYRALIKRRASGEPVAYILGRKEFYSRTFKVGPGVLVPRPETEILVDKVLAWLKTHEVPTPRIVDVGVGSGAIAVTLAAELPTAVVLGVDISAEALEIAKQNADTLGVRDRVKLARGDLLSPVKSEHSVDIVVSNPPYLDDALMASLPRDVRDFEPRGALTGGPDGLDVVRRLITDSVRVLRPGGLLAMEIAGGEQGATVAALLAQNGRFSEVTLHPDLSRPGRVVTAQILPTTE